MANLCGKIAARDAAGRLLPICARSASPLPAYFRSRSVACSSSLRSSSSSARSAWTRPLLPFSRSSTAPYTTVSTAEEVPAASPETRAPAEEEDDGMAAAMGTESRPRRYPRSPAYVLAVQWENGKITDAQFADGLTEQLIELEMSTQYRLPFAQVAMLIQQVCRTPDDICKHLLPRCLALLSRMGPAPLINYNRLVSFLSKKGDLQATLMVYKRMRQHKVAPDRLTLSALLGACSKGGNVDAAFRLFKSLVELGVVPNTTNYNGLIGACSKNKELDLGLSTYAEMKARRLPPDFHTFNVLIELTTGCDRAEPASHIRE